MAGAASCWRASKDLGEMDIQLPSLACQHQTKVRVKSQLTLPF